MSNNMNIQPVTGPGPVAAAKNGNAETPKASGAGFAEVLGKTIDSVNGRLNEADGLVTGLVGGRHANIHETMIAMEKAGISLRLMTRIQSKVIGAYQEIMRLQL